MWHYLGAAGCHSTSGTSSSLTHVRNQSQETSFSLSNHLKMNTNTQSQEPRQMSLHCILQYCPYNCSLWPALYKIVRSLKGISVMLAALHPCAMGFKKKLFSKRSLQDLGHSAKQLTLQPVLTGTAGICHEGLGCRKERGEVSFIS